MRPALTFTVAPQTIGTLQVKGTCGHVVYQFEQIMLGELVVIKPKKKRFTDNEHASGRYPEPCLQCDEGIQKLLAEGIVCGMCGEFLQNGEPVSMYMPKPVPDTPFWQHATHTADGKAIVGCMNMDCCPNGALHAGTWHGDGIATPYVTGTALSDVLGGHVPHGTTMVIDI